MWFETLFGFREQSPQQVRANINVADQMMTSIVNGRSYRCGRLETPTLGELRAKVFNSNVFGQGRLRLSETVGNVQQLHRDADNARALFQVASQFNLLEMVSPSVTPEEGVDIYERDRTQGPACAIACGAGTVHRNYFVEADEGVGQTAGNQIDCLADLGRALGNKNNELWTMRNGYALPTQEGLQKIDEKLSAMNDAELDFVRAKLRIGLHWDTQVTLGEAEHTVSQAYCSALPVAYLSYQAEAWSKFARLVLEASYEATLCAAIINLLERGNNKIFLTLLGGGAFGNKYDWIISAMERAVSKFAKVDLDVAIVSYRDSNERVQKLVTDFREMQ